MKTLDNLIIDTNYRELYWDNDTQQYITIELLPQYTHTTHYDYLSNDELEFIAQLDRDRRDEYDRQLQIDIDYQLRYEQLTFNDI